MPVALVACAVVAACARAPSYMRPSGSPGDAEATLGWWLTGTASTVVGLVIVVLLAALLRRRGATAERGDGARLRTAEESTHPTPERALASGLRWIYLGVAATVVVLIIAFAATMVTLAHAARPPAHAALTLDVTGHQWWWEVRYGDSLPAHAFVTANEIHVPVGRVVRIRARTADVIHSFWIPELAGKVDLIPGQANEMWLRANRPGRYRGQCAEYCGLHHAQMAVYVVADPPARFEAWAANQRREAAPIGGPAPWPASADASDTSTSRGPTAGAGQVAAPPSDTASPAIAPSVRTSGGALAARGERIFAESCGGCHAVRGTEALGRLGPDLTHVASRATIAAGALPNTTGNLAGWIANAQSIKPGSRMPTLHLPPEDLLAVVTYLQRLR